MRKESWRENMVYYSFDNGSRHIDNLKQGSACYSEIRNIHITSDSKLILANFHKDLTEEYIKLYILKLSKIFKFKYKFNNEDEIEITELRSNFYMNTFLCIFRYLFENLGNNGNLNKKLIKTFVEDKRKINLLWKFIDAFNKSKFTMNCVNHCISYTNETGCLELKTTKKLEEYDKLLNKGFSPIHNFFKKTE